MLKLLVHTSASTSEDRSETLIAIASALKNVPVTPVIVMSGRKTTIGVSVEPINGTVNSLSALAVACNGPSPPSRCSTMFSTTTILSSMTRPTAAASPPSVIRLKLCPRTFITMNVSTIVTGTTRPVMTAVPQSRRNSQMISPARNRPMMIASLHARDRFGDDVRLVVERPHFDACGKRRPDGGHLLMHEVGDLHGVAVGLSIDAQEHRRLSVRADSGIDRLDGGCDRADVLDTNGHVVDRLDDDVPDVLRAVHLTGDESEKELVIAIEQSR